jgi:hypothetical protein
MLEKERDIINVAVSVAAQTCLVEVLKARREEGGFFLALLQGNRKLEDAIRMMGDRLRDLDSCIAREQEKLPSCKKASSS